MTKPWAHQIEDTATLTREPFHLLGLGPGLGKSRIVVDAAHRLFLAGEIDALIVVCPAPVRSVWVDPDPVLGEFVKWAGSLPYTLEEYGPKTDLRRLNGPGLAVLVTNPEFLRRENRLKPVIEWAKGRRVFLAVDESWQFQNPRAEQSKALYKLRQACQRVALLNGTPGEPRHLFSQYQILDTSILECKNFFHFRNKYCRLGGYMAKEIVGYKNLEDFRRRTAPFTTIRDARECLDLGPEPVRTQIEARLTPATWKAYAEMRDDMVAWLSETESAVAGQAGVKALRLAQIVNGFVGGVEVEDPEDLFASQAAKLVTREVGQEKLDALSAFLENCPLRGDKIAIFTRFRADVERTAAAMSLQFSTMSSAQFSAVVEVAKLYGGQFEDERRRAKELLAPGGDPRPAIVVANTQSGGAGLNLAAAQTAIFLGHDYSLRSRQQAEARLDRPGQTGRVTFVDVLATGPNGERTIDHVIVGAQRRQQDLSAWTSEQWRAALLGETEEPETFDEEEV